MRQKNEPARRMAPASTLVFQRRPGAEAGEPLCACGDRDSAKARSTGSWALRRVMRVDPRRLGIGVAEELLERAHRDLPEAASVVAKVVG